jgi:hypothetical protein
VALAMNAPMQLSSSNSLISLAMTSSPGAAPQNHNWEQELWFRDGMRTAGFYCPDEGRHGSWSAITERARQNPKYPTGSHLLILS